MGDFDTTDDESEITENLAPLEPFDLTWMEAPSLGLCQTLALSALPGCRFKEHRRNLTQDLEVIAEAGITDVFVLMKTYEFRKYKVPNLLQEYEKHGIEVHHCAVEDGSLPPEQEIMELISELRSVVECNGKILIHCYGGYGRTGVLAACFLLSLDPRMAPETAISHVRAVRGARAIQTVRQWNFVQDFRSVERSYCESRGLGSSGELLYDRSRSVSR
eukprot:TRINITY_DN6008_c0_g1_i1.p1 TRINITY_DN6008_c0_g1~~TRINITY_DN6008_c0_g1_i1.p1  ORF type:complete len:218 (+),score=30.25 TRINITY_DN6008_c0_g1_i1:48-701(+)